METTIIMGYMGDYRDNFGKYSGSYFYMTKLLSTRVPTSYKRCLETSSAALHFFPVAAP